LKRITEFTAAGNMKMIGEVDILLVEDNASDAELALHALKKNDPGYKIKLVRDGAEALEFIFCTGPYADRFIEHLPKLILLDLKLPKVDGLEVLEQVKNDSRTKTIPVVVLTSSQEDRDILKSYQLGANSYIVKPIDFDRFNEAVNHLVRYWLLLNQQRPSGGSVG
jgi:two-component system response regulator